MDVLQHISCLQRIPLVETLGLLVEAVPVLYEHVSADLPLPPSWNIYHARRPMISAAMAKDLLSMMPLAPFSSLLLAVFLLHLGDGLTPITLSSSAQVEAMGCINFVMIGNSLECYRKSKALSHAAACVLERWQVPSLATSKSRKLRYYDMTSAPFTF